MVLNLRNPATASELLLINRQSLQSCTVQHAVGVQLLAVAKRKDTKPEMCAFNNLALFREEEEKAFEK